ncbi:hypothetical protein BLD44_021445 [Mastigocladus laminosus UU774]|nr:hypothetical protein BLD44_021445 [Mastigocladus laminosus UU774]
MNIVETNKPTLARSLPGPFAIRTCEVHSGKAIWRLQFRQPIAAGVAESIISIHTELKNFDGAAHVCLPRVDDAQTIIYPAVLSPNLLFDVLFSFNARDLIDELTVAFKCLGDFLSAVHVRSNPNLPEYDLLPVPRWYAHRSSVRDELIKVRASLPLHHAPRLRTWAAEKALPSPVTRRLIHGRFSTAAIAWEAGNPKEFAVLDWLEVSRGDPLIDIARGLSEIIEAVAAGFLTIGDGQKLARVLTVAAAPEVNATQLRKLVAQHIIDHMSLRGWVTGHPENLSPFLVSVEATLGELVMEAAL